MASKKTTPKKAAAKKAAAKTVAKTVAKTAAVKKAPAAASGSFDLFKGGRERAAEVAESVRTMLDKRKGRETDMLSQSQIALSYLPVRSLQLQWAIANLGLVKGTTEIIGRDRTGKSTFLYNLFGGFMMANSPCCVIVGEDKPIATPWAVRALSTDRDMAEAMVEVLHVIRCSNLDEMAELLGAWATAQRDPKSPGYVPQSVPLVVAVDPFGKFTTKAQSAGVSAYDGRDKQKTVEIGAKGNNWDRAKWQHDWMPRLAEMQRRYNLHVIFVSHQNDGNVAGGAMVPSFIPQYSIELGNRTKSGGQALNQNANLQIVLVERGYYYSAGEVVGRRIVGAPYKNSYGVEGRKFHFGLKGADFQDREGYIDAGLRWDWADVEWMAEHGYLGLRKTGATRAQERFSSSELGFTQLSLVDAAQLLQVAPREKIDALGRQLQIPGYLNIYEHIMQELTAAGPAASAAPPLVSVLAEGLKTKKQVVLAAQADADLPPPAPCGIPEPDLPPPAPYVAPVPEAEAEPADIMASIYGPADPDAEEGVNYGA